MDNELLELICDVIGADPGDLSLEVSREDIDEWDSLNHLRIITAVEQQYRVSLSMDEIESIDSIQRLKELILLHDSSEQAS